LSVILAKRKEKSNNQMGWAEVQAALSLTLPIDRCLGISVVYGENSPKGAKAPKGSVKTPPTCNGLTSHLAHTFKRIVPLKTLGLHNKIHFTQKCKWSKTRVAVIFGASSPTENNVI